MYDSHQYYLELHKPVFIGIPCMRYTYDGYEQFMKRDKKVLLETSGEIIGMGTPFYKVFQLRGGRTHLIDFGRYGYIVCEPDHLGSFLARANEYYQRVIKPFTDPKDGNLFLSKIPDALNEFSAATGLQLNFKNINSLKIVDDLINQGALDMNEYYHHLVAVTATYFSTIIDDSSWSADQNGLYITRLKFGQHIPVAAPVAIMETEYQKYLYGKNVHLVRRASEQLRKIFNIGL